jgi:hypothetical protein
MVYMMSDRFHPPHVKGLDFWSTNDNNWHKSKVSRECLHQLGFFRFPLFLSSFVMVISHKPLNQLSLCLETGWRGAVNYGKGISLAVVSKYNLMVTMWIALQAFVCVHSEMMSLSLWRSMTIMLSCEIICLFAADVTLLPYFSSCMYENTVHFRCLFSSEQSRSMHDLPRTRTAAT